MGELWMPLLVLGTSAWVFFDSSAISRHRKPTQGAFTMRPASWFAACLLCWAIFFPAYLWKRRGHKRMIAMAINEPPVVLPEADLITQLSTLADQHSEGHLTTEEFTVQKQALVRRMMDAR